MILPITGVNGAFILMRTSLKIKEQVLSSHPIRINDTSQVRPLLTNSIDLDPVPRHFEHFGKFYDTFSKDMLDMTDPRH